MGTKLTPVYVTLNVGYLEEHLYKKSKTVSGNDQENYFSQKLETFP